MIAKIKLIHGDGGVDYIFKRHINWEIHAFSVILQPQVGMTVVIPQGSIESFHFCIGHVVADLRTGDTILVERRSFGHSSEGEKKMHRVADQLHNWGWEREKVII